MRLLDRFVTCGYCIIGSNLRGCGKGGRRMPYMFVRHNVEDYERWKPVFEEHGSTRRESGSKGVRLFRNADSPNETVILLEWDDLELPPIGWQLFILGNSKSDSTAFPLFLDTYATRLLAEPLREGSAVRSIRRLA